MSKHKTSSFVSYLVRNELLRTFTKNLNPLEGGYNITATYHPVDLVKVIISDLLSASPL